MTKYLMKKHLAKNKCAGSVLHPEDGGRWFLWKPGNQVSPLHTKELSTSNPNHTRSPWFPLISLSLEPPGKFDKSALKWVKTNAFQILTDNVWHSVISEFTPLVQCVTQNTTQSVSTLRVATSHSAISSQPWHNLDRMSHNNSKSKSVFQMSISIIRNAVLQVQHTFHAQHKL